MPKNRRQILIPLAVTVALLTIGAVICLAVDVGSGRPATVSRPDSRTRSFAMGSPTWFLFLP